MRRRWVEYLPRSIFWRLSGLTALAMSLSVVFVVALFSYNRINFIANGMADQAIDLLADAEDQLDGLSPEAQQEWLARSQKSYAPHLADINSPDAPAAAMHPDTWMTRAIASVLRHKLVGVHDIRQSREPHRRLWVEVDMLGHPIWLVMPLGGFHRNATWQFAEAAGVFALMALAGSALFAWRVNKPLRDLRLAAGRLGRGERPPPLPETGPLEVKELSTSFNRMLTDLAASERERDVMLAGISHDLRTPLARLRLGVEMMNDASLSDGMREDVDDIQRILEQFISFSRGWGDEGPVRTNPAELVHALLARYAREQCAVECVVAENILAVTLQPLAITRALANLIDNARRYGQPPYQVRVWRDGTHLHFDVQDHGPGIPDDQLADALKPFHRLDSARRADGGSGLGFAIVERIARHHGGTLQVTNSPGSGLVASLRIPLR